MTASLQPTSADLDREQAAAVAVVNERPQSHLGVPRASGTPDDIAFANYAYYRAYPDASLKIVKGDRAGAEAWKRIRARVLRELNAARPVSNEWNPNSPTWPLPLPPKTWPKGSTYGYRRPANSKLPQTRHHNGVDLGAPFGTPVLAPESGVIVAQETGWETRVVDGMMRGVKALIMHTDSGLTLLLGGLRPGSGIASGTRVAAGDTLAEVGSYPLLHVTAFSGHLTETQINSRKQWLLGEAAPLDQIDPSDYLRKCAENSKYAAAPGLLGATDPEAGALVVNEPELGEIAEGTPAGVAGVADVAPANTGIAQPSSMLSGS